MRVRRFLVAVGVAAIGSAASAPAAVLPLGTYEVLKGSKVEQTVGYVVSYKTESSDGCWIYHYGDQGSAGYSLKFAAGQKIRITNLLNGFYSLRGLKASGNVRRQWSGNVTTATGPDYDEESCDPPNPPPTQSSSNCGRKTVSDARTSLMFRSMKQGRPNAKGPDLALFGGFLNSDPLSGCPSNSDYGLAPVEAISTNGAEKLHERKAITLSADGQAPRSGPSGLNIPFGVYVSGSQLAEIDWSLRLKWIGH